MPTFIRKLPLGFQFVEEFHEKYEVQLTAGRSKYIKKVNRKIWRSWRYNSIDKTCEFQMNGTSYQIDDRYIDTVLAQNEEAQKHDWQKVHVIDDDKVIPKWETSSHLSAKQLQGLYNVEKPQ